MLSSLTAEDGDRASDVGSSKFMPYEVPNFPSGFSSFKEQVNCLLLFLLYVHFAIVIDYVFMLSRY
jgi:hypothetical protein